MIDLGFAAALIISMWVHQRGRVCRAWSQALFAIWIANEICGYTPLHSWQPIVGLWTDFFLALIALYSFTFGRAPWWVLALSLTWFAQILTHWTFEDDYPTMGLFLNVLCGAQIALVCCERPTRAFVGWWHRESRSHGRVASASRYSTRALGGPDCRPGAMRSATKRLEGKTS